jgi:hypothetical protein
MIDAADGYLQLGADAHVLDRFDLTLGSRSLDRWLDLWRYRDGVRVLMPKQGTIAVVIADPDAHAGPAIHADQLRLDV